MKKKKWYRLDNTGKIFPPVTNNYDPNVFRISCTLKEEINKELLQKALEKTLIDFPVFNSVLRRGFFWYYIEEVDNIKKVEEEYKVPCDSIHGILYRVVYYKKRISLEVSHCLTDASGATVFMKCLVANYLIFKYDIQNPEEVDNSSTFEKSEDAFKKYYKNFKKHNSGKQKSGYKLKGLEYDDYRLKFIEGEISTSKFIALSKKYNCTATEYLAGLLIKSILLQMTEREKRKPVYLTIPVSLRKEFPTNTIRNFFCAMTVSYKSSGEDTIEEIIESIKKQFELHLQKDNLYRKMSEMIFLENVFICRIVPRAIKDIILRFSFGLTRKVHTMGLSNIGRITIPDCYKDYIEKFSFMTSTDAMHLNTCSFEDKFVFSFSSHFVNTEIQKNFIRELISQGIDVTIDTNELEDE